MSASSAKSRRRSGAARGTPWAAAAKDKMQVKDLKAFPRNPRKITDKKLDMLGKAMREFGDLSGVIYNTRTGHLVGGHQRIKHLDPSWEIEGGFIKCILYLFSHNCRKLSHPSRL